MQIEPEALYGLFETLIIPTEHTQSEPVKNKETSQSKKLTLVFSNKPGRQEEDFLNKILDSVHVKASETERFYNSSPEICSEIIDSSNEKIIIWGLDLPGFEKYQVVGTNKSQLILSDDLILLSEDKELKIKLWQALKEFFPK